MNKYHVKFISVSVHYFCVCLCAYDEKWKIQDIEKIMENWMRENRLKNGWIVEFNEMIGKYINP